MKVVKSSDLNGAFTADTLISLGFKYQRGIAVPYRVGRSMQAAIDNGEDAAYDELDTCLTVSMGFEMDEVIYIVLGE